MYYVDNLKNNSLEQGTFENPYHSLTLALQELNNTYENDKENTIIIAAKNVINDLSSPIYVNFLLSITTEAAELIISNQTLFFISRKVTFSNITIKFDGLLSFDFIFYARENAIINFSVLDY